MAPKGRGGRGEQTPGGQTIPAAPCREFPREVLFAILSRLPVKSVLRFTCASKSWRRLVSLPAFAEAHLSRSPAALLLHGQKTQLLPGHIAYAFRPPIPESGQPSGAIHRINFPPDGSDGVEAEQNVVVGAAPNGVVCLTRGPLALDVTLWNPATGSSLRIPAPETPDPGALVGVSAGFGYNLSSKGYAIVRIVRFHVLRQRDVAYLFNFHIGQWRRLGRVNFRVGEANCDAVVNGVPYWKAWEHEALFGTLLKLAWFDVRSLTFRTERFGWEEPEKKEVHLSEVRPGLLGAVLWDRAKMEDQFLEVWIRSTNGLWTPMYRFDPARLPYLGRVVGFFGVEELVQEIIIGDPSVPVWKPALCIVKLRCDVGVRGLCNLVGMRLGTCTVARYRESLTRLPKIGSAII